MWVPEAYIGSITKKEIIRHPEPADPEIPVFLIAEISPPRFFRDAKYYPSKNHKRDFLDTMYRWTTSVIYLVADSRDNSADVFCIAFGPPFNFPLLFGKLNEDCEIYQACVKAFAEVSK